MKNVRGVFVNSNVHGLKGHFERPFIPKYSTIQKDDININKIMVRPVVLFACSVWTLEHKKMIVTWKINVLRNIFGGRKINEMC